MLKFLSCPNSSNSPPGYAKILVSKEFELGLSLEGWALVDFGGAKPVTQDVPEGEKLVEVAVKCKDP